MGRCLSCSKREHTKSGYCLDHLPDELRCTAKTKKGFRCLLPTLANETACKTHSRKRMRRRELRERRRREGKIESGGCWVYVFDTGFRQGDKGTFKIGISTDPKGRAYSLQAGNPYGKVLFAGLVNAAKKIEKQLHKFYRTNRIEREMFTLKKTDLLYIREELQKASTDFYESWKTHNGVVLN